MRSKLRKFLAFWLAAFFGVFPTVVWATDVVTVTTPGAGWSCSWVGSMAVAGTTDWDYFSRDSYIYHVKTIISTGGPSPYSQWEDQITVGYTSGSWNKNVQFPYVMPAGPASLTGEGYDINYAFVCTSAVVAGTITNR